MKRNSNGSAALFWAALAVPVLWFALLGGSCCKADMGLGDWLYAMQEAM